MATSSLLAIAALTMFAAGQTPTSDKKPALSADDAKFLEGLSFLFDPRGAKRVEVRRTVRSVWGSAGKTSAEGWLVSGKDGEAGRVCFADGASIPAPAKEAIKDVDFLARCKDRYGAAAPNKDDEEPFGRMKRTAVGDAGVDDLVLAAWLHRLGQDELAARALAEARKQKEDPVKTLRAGLAWSAFAGLVHAYMVRADEEALADGERLLRLYPDEALAEYKQAALIVTDLKRRQERGTFGKTPDEKRPDGFDAWPAAKKAEYLTQALDEVDARQNGQPGGVDLASDRRVESLIRLGDAAVPALLDAFESDERLTRSVHFWRDFSRSRTVLQVREAELTALMSILRVQVFEPASTGDNFTARGEDAVRSTAKQLREYWKTYGTLPFDERMMKILTDPKANFPSRREAAVNLATLTQDRRLGTTVWTGRREEDASNLPNPAIAKFKNPTTAEAIVTTMDADLAAFDASPSKDSSLRDYLRSQIERKYMGCLAELGDKLAAPVAAKRAEDAASNHDRRQWAGVAKALCDPQPFRKFAEDFAAGKVEPMETEAERAVLTGMVTALVADGTPEADRALASLADPKHPAHPGAIKQLLEGRSHGFEGQAWHRHPFCLTILRKCLDDKTPTKTTYAIEKGTLWERTGSGGSGGGIPPLLSDPQTRHEQVTVRVCDLAALRIAEMVPGMPAFHPLLKDADERLARLKEAFDRNGRYRVATEAERQQASRSFWQPMFVADEAHEPGKK